MIKRSSKEIKDPTEIEYFCNLTEDDMLKLSFIMDNFGEFENKRKYQPYDLITIPAGKYGKEGKKNKKPFLTTIGIWVFNKVFIEKDFFDIFGYINKTIDKKILGNINKKLSYAVIEDKITLDQLKRYIMKTQKFQPYSNILSCSYTDNLLLSTEKIKAKKMELTKKYAEGIKNNDPKTVTSMEKELIEYARDLLKDDPAIDMYESGAKSKFGNNFKNMFISRGIIKHPDPTKGYETVLSSYLDGIKKDEYSAMARSLAAGPFSRGKRTSIGGYWEKLFLSGFQHVMLLPEGSDCHTNRTLEVFLDKDMAEMMMYSYIVDGNKLVELTSDNIDLYLNKKVKFRFASLCESKDGICHKCIGNFFYRIGIKNIGVATPQLASKLKLIAMKAFHDSQVNLHDIDVAKAFGME